MDRFSPILYDESILNKKIIILCMNKGYLSLAAFCDKYMINYEKLLIVINAKTYQEIIKHRAIDVINKVCEIFECNPEDLLS
jgi:hypothetical protein